MAQQSTSRSKRRKLLSTDMEVVANDGEQGWDRFFQANLTDFKNFKNEEGSYVNLMHSGNGIEIEVTQIEVDEYIACLIKVPEVWNELGTPSSKQKLYILMMACCVCRGEKNFSKLNSNDTYRKLVEIVDVKNPSTLAYVKITYLEMLNMLFVHAAGLKWLLETSYWIEIHNLVLEFQIKNESLLQAAHNLLSKVLQRTSKIAPKICHHIIKQMAQSLVNTAVKNLPNTKKTPVQSLDPTVCNDLNASLNCLIEILERLLASPAADILRHFIKLQVKEACDTLAILSNDGEFSLILIRIIIVLSFYEMTEIFDGIKVVNQDPLTISGFLRVMERELRKGHYNSMFLIYYYSQKYWKSVSRKMPSYFVKEIPINIEDELMSFQMEPVLIIAEKLLGVSITREGELRSCYLSDVLNANSVPALHLGYEIRKYLPQLPLNIEITCLQCLIKSKPFYSRKNLALVFQGLIYGLDDFIEYVKKYPNQGLYDQDVDMADTLLEAILVYLENFDLSWRESIGSIELSNLIYDFLYYSVRWSAKTVLKALQILNTTISKHMLPNMALLVDTTQHSSLNELGALLFTKCFSNDPEVRNAALTVIYTLCQKVNEGFNSFQKIIMESLLQDLILTMSVSDEDSTVRTTALQCLQEIIVMEDIGNSLLEKNLVDKILEIISSEEEQTITKEAITLIGIIYQNDKVPLSDTEKLYNIMVRVSINDTNPLVQEYALKFWTVLSDKYLQEHGWLDEEFPPVIFSKEKKKIIRLDDNEIRRRIMHVAEKICKTGVFDVFHHILQSKNTSKEVYSNALAITAKYLKMLQKYEVTPEILLFSQALPNLCSLQSDFLFPSQMEDFEESIMEMINNSEAFSNFEEASSVTNNETGESFQKKLFNSRNNLTMAEFLDFLYRKLPFMQPKDYKHSLNVVNNQNDINKTK